MVEQKLESAENKLSVVLRHHEALLETICDDCLKRFKSTIKEEEQKGPRPITASKPNVADDNSNPTTNQVSVTK